MKWRDVVASVFLLASLSTSPAMAKTHALVIGINSYVSHQQLLGALNDAEKLESVFRKVADGEVKVLREEHATREKFFKSWNELLENASPGDTVIVTFAGHGIQIADDPQNLDEKDGADEALIFQPFDEADNQHEKLLDDEMSGLFAQAEERGLTALFVIDACHSGGVTRRIERTDIAGQGLPYRLTRLKTIPTYTSVPAGFTEKPEKLGPKTVVMTATHESLAVKEIRKDGKPHGALSYYTALGLGGRADLNKDNDITAAELKHYVISNVREAAENRQIPEFRSENLSTRLITLVPDENSGDASVASASERIAELPEIALKIEGEEAYDVEGASAVDNVKEADLIWDPLRRELLNAQGDVLASSIDKADLVAAVGGKRLKKYLLGLREKGRILSLDLLPDDRLHRHGDEIEFVISGREHRYATVFNITSSGTLQFLYPMESDPLEVSTSAPWSLEASVEPPFGSDFLVVISSDRPLNVLHTKLRYLHCSKAMSDVYEAIALSLTDASYNVGLKSVFTQKKETGDVETSCI